MCAYDVMKRFSQEQLNLMAGRARALGEPARIRMLEVLARGEQSVGQLADTLAMQQSTASKHLQVLFHAGFVHRRRDASAVIYSIADEQLLAWCHYLGHRHIAARSRIA
jgi:DNA-binding transcriptional ArsR family regulator